MAHEVHQDPRPVRIVFHEIGGKRLAETVPAQFRRHFKPSFSRLLHYAVEIVPHCLVADAFTTFCEEECRIGLGIGEVGADMFFVSAYIILRKWRENGFTHTLARTLRTLPIPGLDAIVFIEEVSMSSEGIQVADFICPQSTFASDSDHRVVARGCELFLIVADVLQAHEIVELE